MKIAIAEADDNLKQNIINALDMTGVLYELIRLKNNTKQEVQNVYEGLDLLFLYLKLGAETPFGLLPSKSKRNFELLCLSDNKEQAYSAIKAGAIDFIYGPIDPEELRKILLNTQHKRSQENRRGLPSETVNEGSLIAVNSLNRKTLVEVKDILYLKSDSGYTFIHTTEKRLISTKHLKYYQNILNCGAFIRVHRSYLVNINFIKVQSNGKLVLVNEDIIPIAHRKRHYVNKVLQNPPFTAT